MREAVTVSDWETNPERIFPILNKLDRIWTSRSSERLSDIILDIVSASQSTIMTDSEFSRLMDDFIDKNDIK